MEPPQTAEWCRIMDVISVTAVYDLLELGETASTTITTHCMSASVPLETVMNTKAPMSAIKRKRHQWRENQTHSQKQWVLNTHSTVLYSMLSLSSESKITFEKGQKQQDRNDKLSFLFLPWIALTRRILSLTPLVRRDPFPPHAGIWEERKWAEDEETQRFEELNQLSKNIFSRLR